MSKDEILKKLNSNSLYFKHLPYDNLDGITSIGMVTDRITGKAKGGSFGVKSPVSVRMEPCSLHFVDIASSRAGTSRNEMINLILEAGIQAILDKMTDSERESLLDEYFKTSFGNKLVGSEGD